MRLNDDKIEVCLEQSNLLKGEQIFNALNLLLVAEDINNYFNKKHGKQNDQSSEKMPEIW